jgi:hypothetical protein
MRRLSFHMLNLSSYLTFRRARCILYIYNKDPTLQKTHTSPCFWKYSIFIVEFTHNLARVHKLARVPRRQNAKLKLNFYYISWKDSSHFLPLAKFAFITAIFMKMRFLWDVTTNRRVDSYRRCEGSCCLQLQGQPVQEELARFQFSFGRRFAHFGVLNKWRHAPRCGRAFETFVTMYDQMGRGGWVLNIVTSQKS